MRKNTDKPIKLTPMFEQYFSIKKEHEDALLFFRMGDFYELFFDDAAIAAKELQIALTSRNNNAENPIPMCGVPHHAAEVYINQLLDKGFKVAICEQLEDPKLVKGLVKRDVVLVRTPGTSVEETVLVAKENNFLGSLFWDQDKKSGGFAWLEFSTGKWTGIQSKKEGELWQWVQKIQPKELLLPDLSKEQFRIPQGILLNFCSPVRLPVRAYFEFKTAEQKILKAQKIQELGAVGLHDKPELTKACGALIGYLLQTQKKELEHLGSFRPLILDQYLIIDEITEKNLEIFKKLDGKKGLGTLWHAIDNTITPMGGRFLEERLKCPWQDLSTIIKTQSIVELFFNNDLKRQSLRQSLDTVYDLERLSTRIHIGRATPKDLVSLSASLNSLPLVIKALTMPQKGMYATSENLKGEDLPPSMQEIIRSWDDLTDISSILKDSLVDNPPHTLTDGGLFKSGFNKELDELLDFVEHGENKLQELLLKEQTTQNLPKLKLGFNRVFGYYFELTKSAMTHVPSHFIRRQTIANGERYVTPELKELEEKILAAGDRKKQLEYSLFQEIRRIVSDARPRILFMAGVIAALDFWQSLAETAKKNNWCKPLVNDNFDIVIKQGRHPVIENMLKTESFIANDVFVDNKRSLLLITGPNMAGKSTVLRQTAIIILLAQIGSYVPAKEAVIGITDRIFSRVGASDNLSQGQSTFMVEMMETARILRQATSKSFVILDEIGRGTSTFDGLSIAWAVVEYLLTKNTIRTMFATHYHELTALEGRIVGLHNMNIAVKEWNGDIVFLRRLIPGPADRSYGIEVAKLAGVPQNIVNRAKKILNILEKNSTLRKNETENVAQQLLPGIEIIEKKEAESDLLPPILEKSDHPIVTTLNDIDLNTLTPLEALSMLTEWKALWGKQSQDS